jgi:hypothetical protein
MADDREPYGRLVHETRLACEAERAEMEGRIRFNLESWERRTWEQQETDMRIGAAVAAQALADAVPEPMTADQCERLRQMADEHAAAVEAVRRGLDLAAPFHDSDEAVLARAWEALKVLSGEEGDPGA